VRTDSYNQGLVFSNRPLAQREIFEVTLVKLDPKWSASLSVGVTSQSPERIHPPVNALMLKKGAYVISGCSVYQNGVKISGQFGPNLDMLQAGSKIGVSIIHDELHLFINNVDHGAAVQLPPSNSGSCYHAVVDLYGQCAEISLDENVVVEKTVEAIVMPSAEKLDNNLVRDSQNFLTVMFLSSLLHTEEAFVREKTPFFS